MTYPGKPAPAQAESVSKTLFCSAQNVAAQLREAGWAWSEIEQICHFLLSIARTEGYRRRA